MYEVELKVRADHGPVREALSELGATPVDAVEQVDTYYDHPGREFAETDEALRVRRQRPLDADDDGSTDANWESRLTYKGPLVDETTKTREEFETGVADGPAAETILTRLGFEPAAEVRKRRRRFEHDGYTVTLDDVTGLGEFVEVERAVQEDEVAAAREGATDLLRSLGLDPEDSIRTSYLGLLLDGPE